MDTGGTTSPIEPSPGFEPLGFGELLERVFKISWREKRVFATIVALLVGVPSLFFLAAILSFPWDAIPASPGGSDVFAQAEVSAQTSDDFDAARMIPAGVLFAIGIVLAMIGNVAAQGAAIHAAARSHLGLPAQAGPAILAGVRRAHSLLWVAFLMGFTIILVLGIALAPGIALLVKSFSGLESAEQLSGEHLVSILSFLTLLLLAGALVSVLWVWWSLAPAVVVVEPTRGSKALGRSRRLVKGKLFWIGAVLFVALFAQWTIGSVFTAPPAMLPVIDPGASSFGVVIALQFLLGLAAAFVYVPIQGSVAALLYIDARVRKENLTPERLRLEIEGGGFGTTPDYSASQT